MLTDLSLYLPAQTVSNEMREIHQGKYSCDREQSEIKQG